MTFLRLCMYDWPRRCCSSLFVFFFIYLYTTPFYSSSKYGVNHQMLRRSSLRERDSFVIVQFHWYKYNLWSLEVEGTVVQSLPGAGCVFQYGPNDQDLGSDCVIAITTLRVLSSVGTIHQFLSAVADLRPVSKGYLDVA